MNVSNRLAIIERAFAADAVAACGGNHKPRVVYLREGDAEPTPATCPKCGADLLTIVVNYIDRVNRMEAL